MSVSNLNELNLAPDAVGEVDYQAPEPGQFPPSLAPGVHDFQFKLDENPYDSVEIPKGSGKKYLSITIAPLPIINGEPGNALRFQRANFYKHEKMANSSGADLIRSLGMQLPTPLTPSAVADAFQGAENEGKRFRAEVGWKFYCKGCDQTVSTHPRKKKGDVAWPRDAERNPAALVACPKCGNKGYGNAVIINFKLPEKTEATTVSL